MDDIRVLFQIAGIGILVAVIHSVLKQAGKEEFAWLTTLGGTAIVLWIVIGLISRLFDTVETLFRF